MSDTNIMPHENLTKIYIDLQDNEGSGGESLWAEDLGNNLYRVRNSPFFAYDLHFGDIVQAFAPTPDLKPEIIKVVERSGHRTLRVFFDEGVDTGQQQILLGELKQYRASYEKAWNRFYAVDVEPEGDYQAVCNRLWGWEQEGILSYETGMTDEEAP